MRFSLQEWPLPTKLGISLQPWPHMFEATPATVSLSGVSWYVRDAKNISVTYLMYFKWNYKPPQKTKAKKFSPFIGIIEYPYPFCFNFLFLKKDIILIIIISHSSWYQLKRVALKVLLSTFWWDNLYQRGILRLLKKSPVACVSKAPESTISFLHNS